MSNPSLSAVRANVRLRLESKKRITLKTSEVRSLLDALDASDLRISEASKSAINIWNICRGAK